MIIHQLVIPTGGPVPTHLIPSQRTPNEGKTKCVVIPSKGQEYSYKHRLGELDCMMSEWKSLYIYIYIYKTMPAAAQLLLPETQAAEHLNVKCARSIRPR